MAVQNSSGCFVFLAILIVLGVMVGIFKAAEETAKRSKEATEIQNKILAEQREAEQQQAFRDRAEDERRAAQKTNTIVGAAIGYAAAEHIANEAARKVADAIREDRKKS